MKKKNPDHEFWKSLGMMAVGGGAVIGAIVAVVGVLAGGLTILGGVGVVLGAAIGMPLAVALYLFVSSRLEK